VRPAPVAVGKRGELEQAAVRRGPLLVGRWSGAGVGADLHGRGAAGEHGSGSPPPPRSRPAGGHGHGGGDRILLPLSLAALRAERCARRRSCSGAQPPACANGRSSASGRSGTRARQAEAMARGCRTARRRRGPSSAPPPPSSLERGRVVARAGPDSRLRRRPGRGLTAEVLGTAMAARAAGGTMLRARSNRTDGWGRGRRWQGSS